MSRRVRGWQDSAQWRCHRARLTEASPGLVGGRRLALCTGSASALVTPHKGTNRIGPGPPHHDLVQP